MPVALSEWRVRIGTFIHRIKEWVVREMREELLKERIQRLRVLWKRLKAMKDDSEGGSQDQEARQDEEDSSDSSLVNPQGDCNAEPCTKMGQDSPQPCCVGNDSFDSLHHELSGQTLPQQPNLQELMLVTAGDVELNPGPRESSIDSALQEKELVLLAKEVPGNSYDALCIGLGFSYTEGRNVLTKHLLDIPGALIELLCRWKIKQKDGTDCRAVLGEILKEADMDALQTKLLEVPNHSSSQESMTEEQVSQCAEDLKSFYLERMCKIKPNPLDFKLIVEFKQLYTNLVLLRHDKGLTREKTHVDYKDLFTTKVDGVLPNRLLVEGEGGVGKTTLCSKIAWDWAEGYEEYNQFNWVVVVPLRNVIKGQTIGDCMKNYLNENNIVSPKQIENYMICQPSKVLIVLDGLDEYDGDLSTDDGSDISQVLRLDKFQKCTVLVTTRPWKAHQIKCNQQFGGSYAFIAVEGYSVENVSTYISKYFVKDVDAGKELIRFIEVNDVIKENMAPFPIYVAMLCILWENIDIKKLETIRRLKTFSQLFEQMIIFLIDHYVSKLKAANALNEERLENEFKQAESCIKQIGSVAFSGLLGRKLAFKVNDFRSFKDAMETCCRIGVLSRDHEHVSRWKRSMRDSPAVTTNVFFPHKLFQEYVAALYLASLHETDREEYIRSICKVMGDNVQEFRYLLYFTAAQVKEIVLELVNMLQGSNRIHPALMQDISGYSQSLPPRGINDTFLVDVTFEAYDKDIAKTVGPRIFAENRTLKIERNMSAHSVAGYLFIMEQHQVVFYFTLLRLSGNAGDKKRLWTDCISGHSRPAFFTNFFDNIEAFGYGS
nr:protein NLRC5-like [Lytechinus pictus]